jgi:O-antigen ligase
MIILARVVARGSEDVTVPPEILRGMTLGILYEFGLAMQQRYVLHHHQVSGNFPHQNTFGMAVNLVVPALLALKLSGSGGRLATLAIGAGAASIVMTLSRGAMTMFVIGSTVIFLLSTVRRPTAAKVRAGLLGLAAGALIVLRAWDSIVDRFLHAPKESAEGREQFELAASLMLSDHPFGIGINGFSLALGEAGYGARAGIYGYDATGIVHNIYWLTAAEIGWVGILAFVVLLAMPPLTAVHGWWRARGDLRGDVLIGLAMGLLLMDLQGKLEWAFRQTTLSYLFWTIAGMIATLARQVRRRGAPLA